MTRNPSQTTLLPSDAHETRKGRGGQRNSRPCNPRNTSHSRDTRSKGKGYSDRPHNKGKGKDNSSSRNHGNRQPKLDPCSYCGGVSHNARNCFKRLADDKSKTTTMKQANQNIIIDEATMEFSQSVLFSHLSDSLPSTHTARWRSKTPIGQQTVMVSPKNKGRKRTTEIHKTTQKT